MLLKEGIKVAKEQFGAKRITIEAQTYARSLYEKVGFVQTSGEFMERVNEPVARGQQTCQ